MTIPVTLKTISNLKRLHDIRACWETWQNHPNNDFGQFELICGLRSEVARPHVLMIEKEGLPCALLLCRFERSSFSPRIGYFSPLRIPAKLLIVVYEGLIGKVDRECADLLVRHLWSLLSRRFADGIVFNSLPEHSPLMKSLLNNVPRSWRTVNPVWSVHRSMELLSEPDFLLKKLRSKHRSWVKRKQRDLQTAFPGKVSWSWLSCFDDIPGLCEKIERLASRTYQRGLGAGFINDETHRRMFMLFAGRGQLRIETLEIEGELRAYWIGIVYSDCFHSWATGYDPDYRSYELGTLVFLRMLNELVGEGVRRLDFGLGDASYKERFGDRSWRENTVTIFAPSAKGFSLRLGTSACSFLDQTGCRLLEKTGFLNRVKTGWRRRLNTGR